jgi:hypothetical protein
MSPEMNYGEHGQCEATAKSTGERCGRPAIGPHGKCDVHGGKSKKGEDHPAFEHGLFSDYLSEEDRQAAEALEGVDNAEKLEDLINWRLVRLRRYLREMSDEDELSFWDAFRDVVHAADEVTDEEIRELAKMLSNHEQAVQMEIDLVRKLIKAHDKVAGEGSGIGGLRDLFGGGNA